MDKSRAERGERSWQDETPPKMYSIMKGMVASVQPYGAFIKLPGRKKNGLVHRSQISKVPVEKPEEVLEVNEEVYVKVISNEEGKIALSMKVVNQTTGEDLDPNHVQTSLDEQRRKTGFKRENQKIELGAILNTTCKKCGGQGHFTKDCFQTPGSSVTYDLVPDIDHLLQQEKDKTASTHHKKSKKKDKKEKKKKKDKRKAEDSSSDEEPKAKKAKKHHKKNKRKKDTSSDLPSSSESDDEKSRRRKSMKRKHHSKR